MRSASVIPGYRFTFGVTLFYLSLILLIPLAAFLLYASGMGIGKFFSIAAEWRVVHACLVSFFSGYLGPQGNYGRYGGCSVRLVQDAN